MDDLTPKLDGPPSRQGRPTPPERGRARRSSVLRLGVPAALSLVVLAMLAIALTFTPGATAASNATPESVGSTGSARAGWIAARPPAPALPSGTRYGRPNGTATPVPPSQLIGSSKVANANPAPPYLFQSQFGQLNPGSLLQPLGITINPSGTIFVSDVTANRIVEYNTSGVEQGTITSFAPSNGQEFTRQASLASDSSGNLWVADAFGDQIEKFNPSGVYQSSIYGYTPATQFFNPHGVASGPGSVEYVADAVSNDIVKFDSSGNLIARFGTTGSGSGQFSFQSNPLTIGLATDSSGNVYVADTYNNRVQVLNSSLTAVVTQWGSKGSGTGQFNTPLGLAVSSTSGNVYVVDSGNNRIEEFTSAGVFVTSWGTGGSATGQFNIPAGIAIDSADNVYVVDSGNLRIEKFTSSGGFVMAWGPPAAEELVAPGGLGTDSTGNFYVADTYEDRIAKFSSTGSFVTSWGTFGKTGNGQFNGPSGVAVTSAGNVYVVDTINSRVQEFDLLGNFVASWGSFGSGLGQFTNPTGVAVDTSGNVYVVDNGNSRVEKFNANGTTLLQAWGAPGSAAGQFSFGNATCSGNICTQSLAGIAVDANGNVFVADQQNNRIQKFNSNGQYLTSWGVAGFAAGEFGPSQNNDVAAQGVAVDSTGNVYVVDGVNNIIQKFDPNNLFLGAWATAGSGNGQVLAPAGLSVAANGGVVGVTDTGNRRVDVFNTNPATINALPYSYFTQWGGIGPGRLLRPGQVAVDSSGNVYVADQSNDRIQKFDSSGQFLLTWGTVGNGKGQFDAPVGVTVDSKSNWVYVADADNNRIEKFDTSGNFILQWGQCCTGDGQFNYPASLAVDSSGNVYVADMNNNRVQKFSGTGGFLTVWNSYEAGTHILASPSGIATDLNGHVFVSDTVNGQIVEFDQSGSAITQFGTFGSGNDQFLFPQGLGVDGSGNIFVVDSGNERIEEVNSSGAYVNQWGTSGPSNGQFALLCGASFGACAPPYGPGLALDSNGNLYVSDSGNNRIQKFTAATGAFVTAFGGPANGGLLAPSGVALDSSNNVYVADTNDNRVEKFSTGGGYLGQWGTPGSSLGQFNAPVGIATDAFGHIFVADTKNNRIQRFDQSGNNALTWGSTGSGTGQFSSPSGIATDPSGNVYVVDQGNSRVQVFTGSGGFVTDWGTAGSGTGQFLFNSCVNCNGSVAGIAVDATSNVYVADFGNNRIQKFTSAGGFVTEWGSPQLGSGQFLNPAGVSVDKSGNVEVTDRVGQVIQRFDSSGNFLNQWGGFGAGNGQVNGPIGVAADTLGNYYVADTGNNRIEEFAPPGVIPPTPGSKLYLPVMLNNTTNAPSGW